ncbi:hypothetical protein E2562_022214 [Oryza meyeriana var. granulata]|uniref:Uncharacterized protein n=1 Tax=Oryza meyeriana var. granulata TaxID=110450 RepID=A0A6G1DLW5_9ORYZ|nr:hypothetical protein E2562_022214 [Oryza meyeriana var. granulata]
MPLSAASIHRASYHVLLLLAATAAAAVSTTGGDGDTAAGNATATTTGGGSTEMYICYLCTGRNPMMIRRCPIYWDFCHLVCYDAPSTTAVAAVPVAPAAPARPVGGGVPREIIDEECYVMKLYENGSYVIVITLGCSQTARCLLSCGGGDLAADGEEALAALGAVSPPVTAPYAHAMLPMPMPRVAGFQRCGAQMMTTPTPRAITGGV